MLQTPTLNDHTIFTAILVPGKNYFEAYPEDSDYPDVAAVSPITE